MAETIQPLLDRLAAREAVVKNATRERHTLSRGKLSLVKEANSYFRKQEQSQLCFLSASTQRLIDQVLAKYPIATKGTRNGILVKLVGELFRKFGYALAERIVTQHYHCNGGNVRTGLAEIFVSSSRPGNRSVKTSCHASLTLSVSDSTSCKQRHSRRLFFMSLFCQTQNGVSFVASQPSRPYQRHAPRRGLCDRKAD
jgi:hypothetical protein